MLIVGEELCRGPRRGWPDAPGNVLRGNNRETAIDLNRLAQFAGVRAKRALIQCWRVAKRHTVSVMKRQECRPASRLNFFAKSSRDWRSDWRTAAAI